MLTRYFTFCSSPLAAFALLFALAATTAGCVSVSLGPTKAGKADVKINEPSQGFSRIGNTNADVAWQSQKTANTISYLSECPQTESSLESVTNEFHSVLTSLKILNKDTKFYNGRESLWTQSEGKLDGIEMKIASVVFKRNGCSYLLTYVARKDRFKEEYSAFQQFLDGFQAP